MCFYQDTGEEVVVDPEEPLSKEALDEFSNQVLSVCLEYIEKLPETVYKVSDLLTIIVRRNGESFCYKLLNTLAEVVSYIPLFSTFHKRYSLTDCLSASFVEF